MPNLDNAKKALRVSARKRVINDKRRKAIRETSKAVRVTPTPTNLSLAYKAIDKAAQRGVIKKNTAARRKSRLARVAKKASK